MPHSLENPFIKKPDNLNPDQVEFLGKYAGASEEQLKKASLSQTTQPAISEPDEAAASLKQAASEAEKEAYLNEEVECGGVAIKRIDARKVQAIIKQINQERTANGQAELNLGQEIKLDRMKIGGQTKEQLIEELNKAKVETSDYANDILNSNKFKPLKESEDTVLVRLTVSDLGFPQGTTIEEIFNKAQELGLDLCPPETGPQLLIKADTEQRFGQYSNIAMKQITDSDGDPYVFYLGRWGRAPWFHVARARPDLRWLDGVSFVFRLRK